MNWNEKRNMKQKLMENLAAYMLKNGRIKSDQSRSNQYAYMRIVELTFRGIDFIITQVDGMTCLIDRV